MTEEEWLKATSRRSDFPCRSAVVADNELPRSAVQVKSQQSAIASSDEELLMCKKYMVTLALAVTCFAMPLSGATIADDKAEEAKVTVSKLEQGLVDAFGKGAKALGAYLEPLLSDDATITDNGGQVHDKTKFLALAKSGDRGPTAMEQSEVKIQVYGDTAVVTGLIATKTQPQVAFRSTTVYVRNKNQWRIVAMQLTTVSRP